MNPITECALNTRQSLDSLLLTCGLVLATLLVETPAQGTEDVGDTALAGHSGPVMRVAVSADNDFVVSGGDDGTIRLWPLKDWKSDGTHVVLRHPVRGNIKTVDSLDLSSDGRLVASGGYYGSVGAWRLNAGKAAPLPTLSSHTNVVSLVRFSPDAKMLAIVQRDPGQIELWGISGEKLTQATKLAAPEYSIWSLGFSPDSKVCAVGVVQPGVQQSGAVWLWDLRESPPTKRILLKGMGLPRAVHFSPDGRALAFAEGNVIRMVDAKDGKETGTLNGHYAGKSIVALDYSPDGKRLVSGGYDNTSRLWDVASGQELKKKEGNFKGIADVKFANNGHVAVAACKDGLVRIWDWAATPKSPANNATKPTVAERLKRLKDLKEQGLIKQDDYDKKVKEIMDAL